jgi:hypothetical protein
MVRLIDKMWLGIMLLCLSPSATSCEILTKDSELFYSEASCLKEANLLADIANSNGAYAVPLCVKIGYDL